MSSLIERLKNFKLVRKIVYAVVGLVSYPGLAIINKLKISEEEADESVYFLELLREFNPLFKERITLLINEGAEILKIIVASITTTRARIIKESSK